MVNEWTIDDLPTKFDDSRFPRHPWNPSPYLMADLAVWLNEHHPKPAREVTRNDLPDFGAMGSVMARWKVSYGAVSDVLDAVVAHLNANGGMPADDRWRRAHEIVEQERDQARETGESWRISRDEWKECYRDAVRERDAAAARAEAAEARTASTVTRDEVSKVVHGVFSTWYDTEDMVDAVCALFGVEAEPADPVEELAERLYAEYWGGDRAHLPWSRQDEEGREGFLRIAAHVLGQETDQ